MYNVLYSLKVDNQLIDARTESSLTTTEVTSTISSLKTAQNTSYTAIEVKQSAVMTTELAKTITFSRPILTSDVQTCTTAIKKSVVETFSKC